jgi:hypothetical protein
MITSKLKPCTPLMLGDTVKVKIAEIDVWWFKAYASRFHVNVM